MANEIKRGYNYQYDSMARAYAEPLSHPEPIGEPLRRPKTRTKKKVDFAFGMQLSFCGVVLFASALMYINNYATLSTKQNELNALKTKMISIKSDLSDAQAKISESLNLEVIRERAANELGMREPLAHQIVYIQLPEQSYTSYDQ